MAETVLVVGATGNMGVSATMAALRSGRNVLAIVRNQNSAEKLFKHVGSSKGITTVEADVTSDTGVAGVVDQVRAGKLPAFQHVWASVGAPYSDIALTEITTDLLRSSMSSAFEGNFFAYRDTIGYLIEQNHHASSWTICTGAQGEWGFFPLPAMTQGPLFSMAVAASRANEKTNVRFNELFLAFRVEVDEDAVQHGVTTATDFSKVYEMMLDSPDLRGSRVRVDDVEDMKNLKYARKY